MLWKYVLDPSLVIPTKELEVDEDISYETRLVAVVQWK